jgi:hypothetical protein
MPAFKAFFRGVGFDKGQSLFILFTKIIEGDIRNFPGEFFNVAILMVKPQPCGDGFKFFWVGD